MNFVVAKNAQDMARRAAHILFAQVLLKADCVLGLATGSTPLGAYAELAARCKQGDITFRSVKTVNLDEYCGLPPTSPQSYRYYMDTNFFNLIDIEKENTYLPDGEATDVAAECARYTARINRLGGIDLQLLGIGLNGHIGFNEPAAAFVMDTHCVPLSKSTRNANSRFFQSMEEVPTHALTMGMRAILQAKRILLMAGAEKREILEKTLHGPVTPEVPASILQLHPRLTVLTHE